MLCTRTRSTTCSFARANDVKIVRSRDAQSNTEESPTMVYLYLNQLIIYKYDAHFTQNKLQGIQNNYNMEAKLIRCLLNNAIYIRKLVRICRN